MVIVIVIIVYVVSLKLNPYVTCSRCKGRPKKTAWVFRHANHVCSKCHGTGQQLRLGRNILFGRPENPGDR